MKKKIIAILLVAALVCLTGCLSLGTATSGTNSTSGENPTNEANRTPYYTVIASTKNENLTYFDIVRFFVKEIGNIPYDHVAVVYEIYDDADEQNYYWDCRVHREDGMWDLVLYINNGGFYIFANDSPTETTLKYSGKRVESYDISTGYGWKAYRTFMYGSIDAFIEESKLVLKKYGKTHSDGELEGFRELSRIGDSYRADSFIEP